MIGPLTGADARAYRHPPTAAAAAPSATRIRMKVYRKGRDTASLSPQISLLELLDDRFRLRRLGRCRIDLDHFLHHLRRPIFVAFVQGNEPELEIWFAPRLVEVGRPLIPLGGLVGLSLGKLHFAEVVEDLPPRGRHPGSLRGRPLGRLE